MDQKITHNEKFFFISHLELQKLDKIARDKSVLRAYRVFHRRPYQLGLGVRGCSGSLRPHGKQAHYCDKYSLSLIHQNV